MPLDISQLVRSKSIQLTAAGAGTTNGTAMDCRGTGVVIMYAAVGPNNAGNDTTINFKLQESNDALSGFLNLPDPAGIYTDIAGATAPQVGGDQTSGVMVQTRARTKRWIRAVCTIAGTSPAVDVHADLMADYLAM